MKNLKGERDYKPLVKNNEGYFVIISHRELDGLIGRLMQMCDLTGDQEQRFALKSTIKQMSRDWLDNIYEESGYDKYAGIVKDVETIEI